MYQSKCILLQTVHVASKLSDYWLLELAKNEISDMQESHRNPDHKPLTLKNKHAASLGHFPIKRLCTQK